MFSFRHLKNSFVVKPVYKAEYALIFTMINVSINMALYRKLEGGNQSTGVT